MHALVLDDVHARLESRGKPVAGERIANAAVTDDAAAVRAPSTRSAVSASDRSWIALTTLTPQRRACSRSSRATSSWCGGSRCVVGSSSSRTGCLDREHTGEVHSLTLAARQSRQPPLRPGERAGRRHRTVHGRVVVGLTVSEPAAVREPPERDHLGGGEIGGRARFATATQAGAPARAAATLVAAAPGGRWLPARAGSRPARARSSVDLPQPFGPTMLVQLPGGVTSDTPSSTTCEP